MKMNIPIPFLDKHLENKKQIALAYFRLPLRCREDFLKKHKLKKAPKYTDEVDKICLAESYEQSHWSTR